jgi:hypothetical protein
MRKLGVVGSYHDLKWENLGIILNETFASIPLCKIKGRPKLSNYLEHRKSRKHH